MDIKRADLALSIEKFESAVFQSKLQIAISESAIEGLKKRMEKLPVEVEPKKKEEDIAPVDDDKI